MQDASPLAQTERYEFLSFFFFKITVMYFVHDPGDKSKAANFMTFEVPARNVYDLASATGAEC